MHYGNIVICGKPNVGKSSLLNVLLKKKVSIVTPKPQTTRKAVFLSFANDQMQLVFIDTPGYHLGKTLLDEYLNKQINHALKVANCCLFLVDPTRSFSAEDEMLLSYIKKMRLKNIILVITKCDLSNEKKNAKIIDDAQRYIEFVATIAVSSKTKTNLINLFALISKYLVKKDTDLVKFIDDEKFFVSEIVREQIMLKTKKEVPYGVAVLINKYEYVSQKKTLNIDADIIVEKKSHIPIVLGHNGQMIKKIGSSARLELLKNYACKINLFLYVKCKEN
jgi:GTP-binding protein Era